MFMKLKKLVRPGRVLALSVVALCLIMSSDVFGHSLYIQSSRYLVHPGKSTPLFFCYGHHIPVDDGIRAKKLKSIKVYKPNGEVADIAIRNETCLHSYMVNYDLPGTYVLTAETNPGYYTVYKDKKGRDRHTIKPKSAIIDKAESVSKSIYSKQFTKTYVYCGEPSKSFPARVGLPLELVPAQDLSSLKEGDYLELDVYFNGKPFQGEGIWDATYNGFSTQAEDMCYPKTKVKGGKIRMLIKNPGRWFVRFAIKVDAHEKDKEQYSTLKNTATLTFQIPNERKTPKSEGH